MFVNLLAKYAEKNEKQDSREIRIMKLVEKNKFNISEFPKYNFKIAKINSTIIYALKPLKSLFYTQFVEYFTTIAHC